MLKPVSSCLSDKTIKGSLCIGKQCFNFDKYKYCKGRRDTESAGRILVPAVFGNGEYISLSHRYSSVYSAGDDWIGVLAVGAASPFFFSAQRAQTPQQNPISLPQLSPISLCEYCGHHGPCSISALDLVW